MLFISTMSEYIVVHIYTIKSIIISLKNNAFTFNRTTINRKLIRTYYLELCVQVSDMQICF